MSENPLRTWASRNKHRLVALSALAALAGHTGSVRAEDPKCASPNPSDWPPPAKPFFLIAFDTSGSMTQCTNPPTAFKTQCPANATLNSCGLVPSRINDGKCALRKMVQAFGEVDFGLMQFSFVSQNCVGGAANCAPYNVDGVDPEYASIGNRCTTTSGFSGCPAMPGTGASAIGGKLLVGLPVTPTQGADIIKFTDDSCETGDPKELLPAGGTPLNGLLRDSARFLRKPASITALSPSCRPISVILITDGGESCDGGPAENRAKDAAADLFANGIGDGRHVKVYPIGFGGISNMSPEGQALEAIAKAGQCGPGDAACQGTTHALLANNEAELAIQLSGIISGAIQPETCDNVDNNCNGCTDEGFRHYCNKGRTAISNPSADGQCCSWMDAGSHKKCVDNFNSSKSDQNPTGDLFRLPCWDPAVASPLPIEQTWLCANPGEVCDDKDNNCDVSIDPAQNSSNAIDETFNKCGSPAHCPAKADTCAPGSQGVDDDCDGIVDNMPGSSTPGSACDICKNKTTEICDNLDNDCDGIVDNGVPDVPCGPPAGPTTPDNCKGVLKCVNGSYGGACSLNPQPETCDGLDNDCNGKVDDGAPGTTCEIPGKPGLVYQDQNPLSQCKRGTIACNAPASSCTGYVGPSEEVCDGIDNDCDGKVDGDDLDAPIPGVGAQCGSKLGECQPGTRQCVGGTFVCLGGTQPQPELCNGKDDNCNGLTDGEETVFADAPAPAMNGCWSGLDLATCPAGDVCPSPIPGSASWCKPAGASCGDVGSLVSPCVAGTLKCSGSATGYVCKGGLLPAPEKCDGADNDCNGKVDDGLVTVGDDCNLPDPKDPTKDWPAGSACKKGKLLCAGGTISCVDAQGMPVKQPQPETCNGQDDDCNGKIDDSVPSNGDPCEPDYDKTKYPGGRSFTGQCKLGQKKCDPNGTGTEVCEGGIGPSPELCDGLDNDCDGKVDESDAPAPDGLAGTTDPLDKTKVVGAACGQNQGECKPGKWGCVVGSVECVGAVGPQPEVCDCLDNDCDGKIDNDPGAAAGGTGTDPICGKDGQAAGQICANFNNFCQCASKCGSGEFPCPAGNFVCAAVPASNDPKGAQENRCVKPPNCDNCPGQTLTQTGQDGKAVVVCGPSSKPGETPVAECVCKEGQCHSPCYGVVCSAPLICSPFGEKPGSCVENSCFNVPCPGGQLCSDKGECVEDPCKATTCPGQTCKPLADQKGHQCVKSCADVTCKDTEACVAGECKPSTCPKAGCGEGKICDTTLKCVDDPCGSCPSGQVCNPTTKKCGANACEGVVCPDTQRCESGECVKAPSAGGAGGAGGASGSGGAAGLAGSAGTAAKGGSAGTTSGGSAGTVASGGQGTGNTTGATVSKPIGLTTGGGGCSVDGKAGAGEKSAGALAMMMALLPMLRRRRSASPAVRGQKGGK
jgi:MYXO-CTERM domain-containing protein